MSADELRKAADRAITDPGRLVNVDLSDAVADLLECMAEAYDWCAERWQSPDEAARDKVHGYEAALEIASIINGSAS